jgi:hypothetical protein
MKRKKPPPERMATEGKRGKKRKMVVMDKGIDG